MDLSQQDALHLLKALHAEARYREVQALGHEILRSFPMQTEALELLSDALLQSGEYEQALTVLAKALALEPGLPSHYRRKGSCLLALQQLPAAQLCFEQALQVCADHSESRTQLANCLYLQGELDAAIRHCRSVLALEPQNFEAHRMLGNCLSQLGMLQEAAGHFQICVELRPTAVPTRSELAAVLLTLGQHETALQHYRSALLCDATNLAVMRSLAEALLLLERYAEADPLLERMLLLQPADGSLRLLSGQSRERQGQPGKALAFYTEAAHSEDCAREAFYLMMLTLRKLGRYDDALRCCQQVLACDEHYQGIVLHQAQLLAISGDDIAAFASFARFGEQQLSRMASGLKLLQADASPQFNPATPVRVLLHSTGNYSDDLFFLQWLPTLQQADGLNIVLLCPPLLRTLVTAMYGIDTTDSPQAVLSSCDHELSLFALPWFCQQAGLQQPAATAAAFAQKLKQQPGQTVRAGNIERPRIGIAWKGASPFPGARVPALSMDLLAKIHDHSSVELNALQWGHEEFQSGNEALPLVHAADNCSDYYEIATLLCQMDLVITCDCTVAQLAALLGRPLLLLHDPAESAWVFSREAVSRNKGKEGFYPSATLFAQHDTDSTDRIVDMISALSPVPVTALSYQRALSCS